jgi:hypothetical protein
MQALMNGAQAGYEAFFNTLSSLADKLTAGAAANHHGQQ